METLLNALQNADRICGQTNIHFEKAAEMNRQIESLTAKIKKAKKKWIGIGFVLWFVCGCISARMALLGIIGGVILGVSGCRAEKKALEEQISSLQKKAQKERDAAQQIFEANYEALSFLPDDYWYPMATSYLVKAIASKRVETLGDALDRFDAQLHRWKVEEANAAILAQQQAQTEHLKSIRTSSKVNAAANVVNAAANIARLF